MSENTVLVIDTDKEIAAHSHKIQTTIFLKMPVYELVDGHRISTGIKRDLKNILCGEVYSLQLVEVLPRNTKLDIL